MEFKIDYKSNRLDTHKNIFILISLLHINGMINDDSIKALFKLLRENKLVRRVNTYRSNINKKWYNDETTFEIYTDVFESKITPKTAHEKLVLERINKLRKLSGLAPKVVKTHLNFDDIMKYLNLYLNKNKNFCIDHLFFEYIKPAINDFEFEHREHTLNDMFTYNFSELKIIKDRYKNDWYWDDYYDDYDDDYETRRNNKVTCEKITLEISNFLNTKRTHKLAHKELK